MLKYFLLSDIYRKNCLKKLNVQRENLLNSTFTTISVDTGNWRPDGPTGVPVILLYNLCEVLCLGQCAVGVFWCHFPYGPVCSRCDKDIYFRSEWTWEAGTRGRIWSSVRFFQGVVETTVLWKTVKLHQSAISERICSFIHTVHSEKLHIQIFLFDSSFYWFTLCKIVSLSFLSLLFLVAVRGFNSAGVAAAKTSETATPAAVVVKNSSVSCDADIC